MVEVIGVRFRTNGKIYYFDPLTMDVKKGDHVIVETIRGVEYGSVVMGRRSIGEGEVVATLKPIIRIATKEDDAQQKSNEEKCKRAFDICLKKIARHKLNMKLIEAEYTFDNNKLLFYFSADGRVDFRELVSCGRSVCVMRQSCLVGLVSVADRFAVTRICLNLQVYRSRWQRSRIFL